MPGDRIVNTDSHMAVTLATLHISTVDIVVARA